MIAYMHIIDTYSMGNNQAGEYPFQIINQENKRLISDRGGFMDLDNSLLLICTLP